MSWRPRIDEESVFRRWMGIEADSALVRVLSGEIHIVNLFIPR